MTIDWIEVEDEEDENEEGEKKLVSLDVGAPILWIFVSQYVMININRLLQLMGSEYPFTTKSNLLHEDHEEDTRPAEEKMRMASDEIIKIVETVQGFFDSGAPPTVADLREIIHMARAVQKLVGPCVRQGGMLGKAWFFLGFFCFQRYLLDGCFCICFGFGDSFRTRSLA